MFVQCLIYAAVFNFAEIVSEKHAVVIKLDDIAPPVRNGHRQKSYNSEEQKMGEYNNDVGIHAAIIDGVKGLVNVVVKLHL